MHIFCIDLYSYNDENYLTGIDVFSKYPYCDYVSSKEASVVKEAYLDLTSLLGEPEILLHDGGGEFTLVEATEKRVSAAHHPQQNGILERFHKELGKMSRIHHTSPNHAVKYLRTTNQKLLFFSQFKIRYLDKTINVLDYKVRTFQPYDLVWRAVPMRKRAKHEQGFTGPHRVLKKIGEFTYKITSSFNRKNIVKVNVNDLKKMTISDPTSWVLLNSDVLTEKMNELDIPGEAKDVKVVIDFQHLSPFILDHIDSDQPVVFVVPDWPCCAWYKPLHRHVSAEAVELPDQPDLFLDPKGNPIGSLAWKNWLFYKG